MAGRDQNNPSTHSYECTYLIKGSNKWVKKKLNIATKKKILKT